MTKSFLMCIAFVSTAAALTSSKLHTEGFQVDVSKSSVHWIGKKIGGQHDGYVKVKSGTLVMNHGTPEAGQFELDMTSISCVDIKDEKQNANLVRHLKSDDFFSVDKFPVSTLTITRIVPLQNASSSENNFECFGNLNIKGINKPVQFSARFEVGGHDVKATAKIVIDRTKWDISYKSGTIFPSLADKAIADNIEFEVSVLAVHQH